MPIEDDERPKKRKRRFRNPMAGSRLEPVSGRGGTYKPFFAYPRETWKALGNVLRRCDVGIDCRTDRLCVLNAVAVTHDQHGRAITTFDVDQEYWLDKSRAPKE